jgi:hypothetical protein
MEIWWMKGIEAAANLIASMGIRVYATLLLDDERRDGVKALGGKGGVRDGVREVF